MDEVNTKVSVVTLSQESIDAVFILQFQHPNPSEPGHPSLHSISLWHNPQFNGLDPDSGG